MEKKEEKVTTGELIWNCICDGCFQIGYMNFKSLPQNCNCGGKIISHDEAINKFGLGEIKESEKENGVKVRITKDNFHLVSDI